MPTHGEMDKDNNKIYCGYWMSPKEWEEIHSYYLSYEDSEKIETPNEDD